MRSIGSASELEHRRQLAARRVREGDDPADVAEFLGVDLRTVRRWVAAFRAHGARGLAARPVPGRPPKLTRTQEKVVRRWLADDPTRLGFPTELWTGGRLARPIEGEWG